MTQYIYITIAVSKRKDLDELKSLKLLQVLMFRVNHKKTNSKLS